ncbi:Os02g0220800 [Oryza sativa Japonica Group]|uniref:Os02g0220800 protein n=2 Tax=Oryza sativa subsp. japonica TaxID=39947 RepID=A0A0P0VGK0_ORYSJ|nr:hypothetical protein EE612_009831 [Oryza sativa]BAD17617.1 unknown protein [Oryza sativa Japonica Group]BAF08234.1 Os02g0220800 [Oryza sativa Japonica Group]BAS77702.1 Os02g0220800 [Oryza sativa Japonica Group]|eukprot:NP_001046320.1 Os02g0220800 [Oryza sativa Japonica Group]
MLRPILRGNCQSPPFEPLQRRITLPIDQNCHVRGVSTDGNRPEGGQGGEFGLEVRMHRRAAHIVEPVGEPLVVVDDAVVPVPRGEGLHGAPVPGGAAEADALGGPDLDRVGVHEPRVIRRRDGQREPHLVLLLQPRHRRVRPHPPRLRRRRRHRSRNRSHHRRRLGRRRRGDDRRRRQRRGLRRRPPIYQSIPALLDRAAAAVNSLLRVGFASARGG